MSDAIPAQPIPDSKPPSVLQQKSILAVSFLILMFALGVLLVYLVDVMQPSTAVNEESIDAEITTPKPADASVAAGASNVISEPDPVRQLVEETQSMRELLAVTQQRVQTVEDDLKALKDRQEAELQRIADELTLAKDAKAPLPSQDDALAQLKSDYAALNAQFTDVGALVSLTESDLSFPMGGAVLPLERSASLEKVAEFLGRHQNLMVLLQGHTDASGNASRNLSLSEQRAVAVREALVGLGVAQDRIRAEGMGESKPIASNDSVQGRSRNRRVEIYLTER